MSDRDRRLASNIERWFAENARDLPWRTDPRIPYRSLVSELMLQQTQVSRVIARFNAFIERYPTVRDLAASKEDDVLALWSGLGYYRRARMLRDCAMAVVEQHNGTIPSNTSDLLKLPGIGRYTAGAISSIAYGERAPLVDGNVARVLLRIDGIEASMDDPATARSLWARAEQLVHASSNPALLNEGLMELGATVCSPSSPSCERCPVARSCRAKRDGTTDRIPVPKKRASVTELHIATARLTDPRGRILIEQRPTDGLWASLWHGPSLESTGRAPTKRALESHIGPVTLRKSEEFTHVTTHRLVRFRVYAGEAEPDFSPLRGTFRSPGQIGRLALSTPHRRALLGKKAIDPNSR